MEAATAAATREVAGQALETALARRREAEQAVGQAARGRWDTAHGMLLTAASLAAVREAEASDRGVIEQADRDAAAAERALVAASRVAEAAAAAMVTQAVVGLRRERLAAECAARLRRRLLRDEEAVLDDGHGHQSTGPA